MEVTIQSIRFDADIKLLSFIQKKLEKLETFFDRIIGAEVYLKLEKGQSANMYDNKTVEIKVKLPGSEIFAKETSKSFEASTDVALEALKQQLKRHKDKLREHKASIESETSE
jgi:putative sigma-54 modulation protein